MFAPSAEARPVPAVLPTCLTFPEAARRLGVTQKELLSMVRLGAILTLWLGRRRLVPVSELEQWA